MVMVVVERSTRRVELVALRRAKDASVEWKTDRFELF